MAVVTKYGRSFKDPSSVALSAAAFAEGKLVGITTGPIAIANGDSANSLLKLGKVPSSAILLPGLSTLYHTAITGLNSLHIGVHKDGVVVSANALANALDLTAAGSKSVIAALATGSMGKRLYEVLGLTNDPGCEYELVAQLNAAATAAGTVEAFIGYAKK